jgi:hypothetical protein
MMNDREALNIIEVFAWSLASISFGFWQRSVFAGLFMAGFLVFFSKDHELAE